MLKRVTGFVVNMLLMVCVTFYLVKADIYLASQGILPVAPSALFIALSLPLIYGVLLVTFHSGYFVSLLYRCRSVLFPFLAIVMFGLVGVLIMPGGFPSDSRPLFFPVLDFYTFVVGILIGGLTLDTQWWRWSKWCGLAVTVGTIFVDAVRPHTFTLPELVGPAGLAQNPNLGAMVTLALLAVVLDWQKRRVSAADFVVIAIALLTVFVTGSRSGILMSATVVLLYLYRGRAWLIRPGVILRLGLLMLVCAIWLATRQNDVLTRAETFLAESSKISQFFEPGSETLTFTDISTLTRLSATRESLELIVEHPILGVGTGHSYEMQVGPHNMYLARWVDNGIAGLSVYLWFLAAALGINLRNKNVEGTAVTLVVIMFGVFSHNVLEDRTLLLLLAMSTARGVVLTVRRHARPISVRENKPRGVAAQVA